MLGLGNSITNRSVVVEEYLNPSSISGLVLWLGFNQGITASNGNSTASGNMAHSDQITRWEDLSGNNNHAQQSTASDMPRWDTANSGKDIGGVKFANNAKYMDLTSNIAIEGDFTIMIRFRLHNVSSARSFLGNAATDVFKMQDADDFRAIIGGVGAHIWEDTSATDLTVGDPDYRHIVTFTRKGAVMNVYVNGGTEAGSWRDEQNDVDWDASETHLDSDAFTIGNIGTSEDDTANFNGWFYDVLIYDGTVLTTDERKLNYAFLTTQQA